MAFAVLRHVAAGLKGVIRRATSQDDDEDGNAAGEHGLEAGRRPDDGDEDETPARKKQRLSGGGGGGSAYISADLPRRSLSEQAPADRLLALRRLLEATIDWDGSVPMLGRAVAQSSFLIPLPACLPYVPIDENVQRSIDGLDLPDMGSGLEYGPGPRLVAIRTDGDGDCLLHATALGLWGAHDRDVVLRRYLSEWVLEPRTVGIFRKIWEDYEKMEDEAIQGERSPEQLAKDWEELIVMGATVSKTYLVRFHIFLLAHVIRRPIIVYADTHLRSPSDTGGDRPYAPLDFRGMYLPTEISPRHKSGIFKAPLLLAYTVSKVGCQGHFTALLGVEGETLEVPIVDGSGELLPTPYARNIPGNDNIPGKLSRLRDFFNFSDGSDGAFVLMSSGTRMPEECRPIRLELLRKTYEGCKADMQALEALMAQAGGGAPRRRVEEHDMEVDVPEPGVQTPPRTGSSRNALGFGLSRPPPASGYGAPSSSLADNSFDSYSRHADEEAMVLPPSLDPDLFRPESPVGLLKNGRAKSLSSSGAKKIPIE